MGTLKFHQDVARIAKGKYSSNSIDWTNQDVTNTDFLQFLRALEQDPSQPPLKQRLEYLHLGSPTIECLDPRNPVLPNVLITVTLDGFLKLKEVNLQNTQLVRVKLANLPCLEICVLSNNPRLKQSDSAISTEHINEAAILWLDSPPVSLASPRREAVRPAPVIAKTGSFGAGWRRKSLTRREETVSSPASPASTIASSTTSLQSPQTSPTHSSEHSPKLTPLWTERKHFESLENLEPDAPAAANASAPAAANKSIFSCCLRP